MSKSSKSYSSFVSKKSVNVPISQPLPGREAEMVANSTGAFVFNVGEWKQLDRFLILGAAAPTYYASRKKLVVDNVDVIKCCIKENGAKVVERVVEISESGRAPKNEPCLFVLALCFCDDNENTRKFAFSKLNNVARTGTHLFQFMNYLFGDK